MTRHGNREDFVDPEWAARADRPHDPDLSPDGVEQAQRLAERLARENIAHVFASPFLRTVRTASIVAEALDRGIYLEPGIAEWMNPEWFATQPEPLPTEELVARFPRVDRGYMPRTQPSYPETENAALDRAGATVRRLVKEYPGVLLFVGHGASVAGAIRGLVPNVLITECALCSLFRVTGSGASWRLDLQGDVSHLRRAASADRFH